jgi:very-short-patch-repair endonuclease/DNA polymerase III delta prime subunit
MNNTDKIISLYKYVKELCALKYTVVTDIDKQFWTCFLKDIPNDPENIIMYYRDSVEEEVNDNMVLLEVKKPEFHRCPEPPTIIVEWLEPGWDRFTNTPILKKILVDSDKVLTYDEGTLRDIEYFEDSNDRIQAFEKWIALRDKWADKQRVINETRRFFARLYQAYTDLEREPETLEFMIGNGVVLDLNNQSICHPVLLKRVKFEFDAKNNIIRISDTDTEPELYTLLFQEMNNINYGVVRQLKEDLSDNFYHPLDRNDTPDYLKALTHRLCSESKFIMNGNDQPERGDKIVTRWSPVYFIRKRIDGALKAIEEIVRNIENTGYVPGHLIDLVGSGTIEVPIDDHELSIDEQLAALNGENVDILLSKEANREQLEIAERIEHYNAVLVQGPPGTGKTHTIANLLGHFLAHGKSILVTSQTKKALSVLKSHVPEEIQSLCVSVLDDTNHDMVRSIDGISEYMSKYTSNELKKKIEMSAREREEIIKQLAEVRRKIYTIKYREFEPLVYNGESFSPAKAAEFVNRYADELSYIPGKVRLYCPLPVSIDELQLLYRSNADIALEDEIELAYEIPNPELLMSPTTHSVDIHTEAELYSTLNRIGKILSVVIRCDYEKGCVIAESNSKTYILVDNPKDRAIEDLEIYVNSFSPIDGWMIQAAVDGYKGGGYRQKWEMLVSSIEDTASYAESIVTMMLGKTISINKGIDLFYLKCQILKISDIFQRKGKISKIDFFFNKSLKDALSIVLINGKEIASSDDCNIVLKYIELLEKRTETELLWDELMGKHGSPTFAALGEEPEEICRQRIPNIQRYLDWYKNEYTQFSDLINTAGLNSEVIFTFTDLDSILTRTEKILKSISNIVPIYIRVAKIFIQLTAIEQRRKHAIAILSEGKRKNSTICISAISALREKEIDQYEEEYRKLSQLYEKYALQAKRKDILAKIEAVAPAWAAAIGSRDGIHGETVCPDTIEQAWKWKQFAGIIEEITAEPYEELQRKAVILSKELRLKTAELAANKAWYYLILRTERNLETRHALVGWKLTVKKIGKGTGKNAPALRKQARDLMAKCQAAVPAWIMPIGKALESFDPSQNSFDVVIVDEASQSDVTALAILYLAKKVIIVGDDKQVSPMAIGINIDRINALREMYIKNAFDTWHLYDAKTSLYDIAATTYHPLMLREHFRCVPEIIGYSNKLSYDFKIKPLRDASKCVIGPPVVSYRVMNGQRGGHRKINIPEAETVVALMIACMEQPEYELKTFGVISLLGDDQARLIQQIIFNKIEPNVIEERRILCGNASHFQGDERDVMFLSMVDSNEGDGPLRLSGEGVDQSTKQRYNVAASRARDQLWVVHSLDYSKDLKPGDIRRDLLEYCDNPQGISLLAEAVEEKAESPFEEAVGKSLISSGYHITQQWRVGAYRIDMVVQYNGNKVAIECDGEQYHSGDEKVRSDMERQTILERMGWRFIRIRGSEYYRDPDATIARVINELTNHGILPENKIEPITNISSELLSRVKIRAMQILDEWNSKDEDTVENENDINKNVITYSHVSRPEASKRETRAVLHKQLTIDQLETSKTSESTQKPSNEVSNSSVTKNGSTMVTAKMNNSRRTNAQRTLIKQGEDILHRLRQEHIHYIDKIEQSGIIWVPFSSAIKENFENIVSSCGYRFSFEPRGSLSTENKAAWRIMVT